MAPHVAPKRRAVDPRDDFGRAQHRTAQRLTRIGNLLKTVEDAVVRRIVGLADLLQHHRAFALQLLFVEGRVLQDIGDDIQGERRVLGQDLGIVGRALAAGVGVQVTADRLDLLGDIVGRAALGALEGHVLEQMGDAVDFRRLVAGSDTDPGPQRHRFHGRHGIGGDSQPVVQGGEMNRHASSVTRAAEPRACRRT